MAFAEAIRRESERFYAIADGADPARHVAGCPAWDIADLVWHLGEVQWFWATVRGTGDGPGTGRGGQARPAE